MPTFTTTKSPFHDLLGDGFFEFCAWKHTQNHNLVSKYVSCLVGFSRYPWDFHMLCFMLRLNVVNAVFVQQTMKTASSDEELAFKQKERDISAQLDATP